MKHQQPFLAPYDKTLREIAESHVTEAVRRIKEGEQSPEWALHQAGQRFGSHPDIMKFVLLQIRNLARDHEKQEAYDLLKRRGLAFA